MYNLIKMQVQSNTTKPFLKWAGGKSQTLPTILDRLPVEYDRYFEPFLGAAAVFFGVKPKKAILGDINEELINTFKMVRDNLENLIDELSNMKNEKAFFYKIRALSPHNLSSVKRAARFIYLNKTCFNGLHRVNKSGQFNTPFGNYRNPNIADVARLEEVKNALKNARLIAGDYTICLKDAKKGDFIYFDPPYIPLGSYSDFKRYNKEFFYNTDHEQLAELYHELDSRGCLLMLSNSDTPLTRSLYKEWKIEQVQVNRMINSRADSRGKVNEILVTNY